MVPPEDPSGRSRDRPSGTAARSGSAPPEVPAFVYHNALAGDLRADLEFLARNGYTTLTASQLVDVLTGTIEPPERPVALTFDDGLVTLRSVGLPLFEEFDARATVFAITGLTPDGSVEPAGDERDHYRLMGWADLRQLAGSGRVEIGSHGHRHNPVWVGTEPGPPLSVADYDRLYDVPVPYGAGADAGAIRRLDGVAERPSAPLFAAEGLVRGEGPDDTGRGPVDDRGREPGDRPGNGPGEGLRMADARDAVVADLRASRRMLADRLGLDRFHLALPYGAGHEDMPELAEETGFESIFWCRRPDRDTNRPGDDPYRIVRRKMDFVRRLPGEGRRSLVAVYVHKVVRRLTSDPWL